MELISGLIGASFFTVLIYMALQEYRRNKSVKDFKKKHNG